jgi:hypothetical protein
LEGFRVVGLGFGTGGLGLEMVGEFVAIVVIAIVVIVPPIFPIRRCASVGEARKERGKAGVGGERRDVVVVR